MSETLDAAVERLLTVPDQDALAAYYAQRIRPSEPLAIRTCADPARGRGVFATRAIARGEVILRDFPLVAVQSLESMQQTRACQQCFRELGRGGAASGAGGGGGPALEEDRVDGRGQGGLRGEDLGSSASSSGASGDERLCDGSEDADFCSERCRQAAVLEGFELLRGREDAFLRRLERIGKGGQDRRGQEEGGSSKGREVEKPILCDASASAPPPFQAPLLPPSWALRHLRPPLAPALPPISSTGVADERAQAREVLTSIVAASNDALALVARALLAACAKTLVLAAVERGARRTTKKGTAGNAGAGTKRTLEEANADDEPGPSKRLPSGATTETVKPSAAVLPPFLASLSTESDAFHEAWLPYAAGAKRVWWELPISGASEEESAACRADRRELCADTAAALRALCPICANLFPALFDARTVGGIVGMVELNDLALVVPLEGWKDEGQETKGKEEEENEESDDDDEEEEEEKEEKEGTSARMGHEEEGDGREDDDKEDEGRASAGDLEESATDASPSPSHASSSSTFSSAPSSPHHGRLTAIEGTGFFPLQSCFNHSCVPNVRAFKTAEGVDATALLGALRDVREGEELTISYIDETAPYSERVAALAEYTFTCACEKCTAERKCAE